MPLKTRLTQRLGIQHPVLLAPMGNVSGGALAGAVSAAGGLGMIGGGYGDRPWLEQQFAAAGNHRIGCGFITWSLARQPELLDLALLHRPAALMLSFGDPQPFAGKIKAAGALLICQIQTLPHLDDALRAGADIIVAQGSEAGGHGAQRATLPLVPQIVDRVAKSGSDAQNLEILRNRRDLSEARVRDNVQKLIAFTSAVEKNCGTSARLLWSESDENLAQKLIARLQKVQ
jgi:nitronate monooxygenase